jgi:hypothetical protein
MVVIVLGATVEEGYGQMNRRSVRKNNKRISSYRGKKFGFGKEKRYNTIGISLNALNYYGDLSPLPQRLSTDISFTRPGIGLSFGHRFGPRYTLQGSFLYGTLRGSDSQSADPNKSESVYRYVRNLSFRNRIKELTVVAVFDLFENQSTYISRAKWTPYAFAGLTAFHHNPQALAPATDLNGQPLAEAGQWVDLQPLGTEGQYADLETDDVNNGIKPYKRIQLAIPFGIGARVRLNEVMDLSLEFAFRYLFTDYVDDVSKNYVDLNKLDSELAKALSYRSNEIISSNENVIRVTDKRDNSYGGYTVVNGFGWEFPDNVRGNKNDKDIYTVTTIRLSYIVGKTFHRAKFR